MQMKNLIKSLGVLAMTATLSVPAALAQEEGLVNISVEGNSVQVPIDVAAQVCPNASAEVLSQAVTTQEVVCDIDQDTAAQHDIQVGG